MKLLSFFLLLSGLSFGQIPTGYYDPAQGLTGLPLKAALNDIISGHTEFPYSSTGTDVWDILKETDKDTIDPSKVICIYSGFTRDAALEYDNGAGWTREHVWAKSHGNFGTTNGAGTDVHHLRPADNTVNTARSNRWFAACNTPYMDGDGPTGSYYSTTQWIWQPRDEVKGDVARMLFYMAVRYEGENGELDLELIDSIPSDDNLALPLHSKLTDLLLWHLEDPVSNWERNRNDIIYYNYQNNRNPFIDHPEFAIEIWGDPGLGVNELVSSTPKTLVKVVDFLGRETEVVPNAVLIYIYSDGSVERTLVME